VRGGGPGTREDALLDPVSTVDAIDAITLSGGSAFGLDAGGGVQAWLAERGRGFRVRDAVIPIVTGAICFDLLNGGNKAWGRFSPYRDRLRRCRRSRAAILRSAGAAPGSARRPRISRAGSAPHRRPQWRASRSQR
jgi:L-aminopeptidase/D-esterase-like protein